MVALLRAVNVGGTGAVAMADLRRIATDLGYGDVATYIQSGNLVLSTDGAPAAVATDLERRIAAETSGAPSVIVRTRAELASVVTRNPFVAGGAESAHLHVVFTAGDAAAVVAGLDLPAFAPEEAHADGAELFLHLPGGVGRSPLATQVARRKDVVGTMRGWRTVTKLLAMVEQVGG